MYVTAYCLCYGHWTVIPHQLEESFREMVDCGFNAVALSFSESEMMYSRRAFEIQVNLAHKCGLKVFVVPSRLGNRFAGAPFMPSIWLLEHPESQIPGYIGWTGPMACLENIAFREWNKSFLEVLVRDYPIDGIIWDEPKEEQLISLHEDTIEKFGNAPIASQMEDGFVDYLDDLTKFCLSINPELFVTIFNRKPSTERFTQMTCNIKDIHCAGYDGNLNLQSYFHEPPEQLKYRIESVWERTEKECLSSGKKTFALIENMLMPEEEINTYQENLDKYLQKYRPDHLAFYFYAHNNENPEKVHKITKELMQKYL